MTNDAATSTWRNRVRKAKRVADRILAGLPRDGSRVRVKDVLERAGGSEDSLYALAALTLLAGHRYAGVFRGEEIALLPEGLKVELPVFRWQPHQHGDDDDGRDDGE